MTALILSDVHLVDGTSLKSRVVIRFLQEIAARYDRLYILGDFFDVWPGTNPYLLEIYRPVLEVLADLARTGRQVHYLEGNHDFEFGSALLQQFGITTHPNELVEVWNGKRVHLVHGDLGNPRDRGYKVLRWVLRSRALHGFMRLFPGQMVYRAGLASSRMSRDLQEPRRTPEKEARIRHTYRESARKILAAGHDVVIMGHTHLPEDIEFDFEGRKGRYLNTGDWVTNFTYLVYDGSDFQTKTHPIAPELDKAKNSPPTLP